MDSRIYFDNAATTPLTTVSCTPCGRAWKAVGAIHPVSIARAGRREAVNLAREQVARLIRGEPNEIVFTSSGTEADTLAIRVRHLRPKELQNPIP